MSNTKFMLSFNLQLFHWSHLSDSITRCQSHSEKLSHFLYQALESVRPKLFSNTSPSVPTLALP